MGKIKSKTRSFIKRYWLHLILALILILVYRGWLHPGPITYGDWRFYSTKHLAEYVGFPSAWDPSLILGQSNLVLLFSSPIYFVAGLMAKLGIPFAWSERLVWLFPCIVLAPLSAYYLGKTVFKEREAALVCAAVFSLNSCFLERFIGSAHVNIATAFALAPLVLALLLRAKQNRGLRYPVLAGLVLCLQTAYDLRISYLTVLIAILGWIVLLIGSVRRGREGVHEGLRWGGYLAMAIVILLGANLFWILPTVLGNGFQLPGGLGQSWWIPVLSFNKLIHGFAMHDVSWPGRAFEQIGYPARVNPLFMLFPLVGFGTALLALRRIKQNPFRARVALAGCALVLVGVFLVSGASLPDKGRIYIWLFEHLPGFNWFRDPSKMYLYVMLGYSILFGLAATMAGKWLRERSQSSNRVRLVSRSTPAVIMFVILCLLALPAFSLSLGGISKPVKVPRSYTEIDHLLVRDRQYSRIFWYPEEQQFAVKNDTHPATHGGFLFTTQLAALSVTKNPLSAIKSPLLPGLLDAMAVRMMAIPDDSSSYIYPHYADPEIAQDKRGFMSLSGGVPGNLKPRYYGGTALFKRTGGKDHFFVPARVIGILGGWDSALLAHGTPGLDLNNSVYLLSEQDKNAARAFTDNFPADAYLSCEPTRLDTVMPFVEGTDLIQVNGAANQGAPWVGWTPISTADYSPQLANYLGINGNEFRSGDYGLGAALTTTSYETPSPEWQANARLINVINVDSHPPPMTTDANELRLDTDASSHALGEKASIRGSLGPHPPREDWLRAWSYNVKAVPSHPYGVRFSISGRQVGELHTKVTFYSRLGQDIGEQVVWTGKEGSFGYQQVTGNFATPAETASFRLEVFSRENPSRPSSWNLGNVEFFDLAGLTNHPEMEIKSSVEKRATYHLLARCYQGTLGGKISFSVDGGKPVSLNTRVALGCVRWSEIGKFDLAAGTHRIEIKNLEGTNLINTISLVTGEEIAAPERSLANSLSSRDLTCVLSVQPEITSYESGILTRAGKVYCPRDAQLTPAFPGSTDFGKTGVRLRFNGAECDLNALVTTGQPGWVAAKPVSIPRGDAEVQVGYPATSLVNLPSSRRVLTGAGAEWSSPTGGVALGAETSLAQGQTDLTGTVPAGDPYSMKVARSKQFDINPKTKYSSFVKLDGQNMKGLQVALLMLDKDGRELGRAALTDEMNGTFNGSEVFREVETTYAAARYGAVEVICHPNTQDPSSWRLSGLFLNETSSTASPIDKVALIPQSWAQGSAGTIGKEEPPAKVKVLQSSPTGYRVKVIDAKRPFMLVFSEQYAPDWELFIDGKKIKPVPVDTLLNGYPLKKKGTYEVSIRYHPQKWVNIGLVPSILTLLLCFGFLIISRYRKRPVLMAGPKGEGVRHGKDDEQGEA